MANVSCNSRKRLLSARKRKRSQLTSPPVLGGIGHTFGCGIERDIIANTGLFFRKLVIFHKISVFFSLFFNFALDFSQLWYYFI